MSRAEWDEMISRGKCTFGYPYRGGGMSALLYPGRILFDLERSQFVKLIKFDSDSFRNDCHEDCRDLLWYVVAMQGPFDESYSVRRRFLVDKSPLELLAECAE